MLHEEPGAVEHVLGDDVLLCQEGPAAGISTAVSVGTDVLQVGTKNLEDCCLHSEEVYAGALRCRRR